MEISYGLVNLMYFMLCSEHWRIKGSRSNKRRKLLTCFTNSLFKVYNNLSLRETGPEVYNINAFYYLQLESSKIRQGNFDIFTALYWSTLVKSLKQKRYYTKRIVFFLKFITFNLKNKSFILFPNLYRPLRWHWRI